MKKGIQNHFNGLHAADSIYRRRAATRTRTWIPFPRPRKPCPRSDSAAARSPGSLPTPQPSSPAQRKGFIRRIIDYYSRSNIDRTFEKRKSTGASSPGPELFVGCRLRHRVPRGGALPNRPHGLRDRTVEYLDLRQRHDRKFVLLRFSGDNIFNHNKQRLSYAGAFVYFPGAFYGVGYNAGAEGYAQELTTTMGIFRISYCTALAGRFTSASAGASTTPGRSTKTRGWSPI